MKITIVAAVAIIVAILIAGALFLNYDFTPNPFVEISSFNTTGTSSGSVSSRVNVWFVLNLTNTGAVDAKDLSITFSTNTTVEGSQSQHLVYTNSTPAYEQIAEFGMGDPCILGGLKAGETKEFRFYWDVSANFNATALSATLKFNEATLDHAILAIPPIPNVKITNFVCLGTWHGTALGAALDLFSLDYTNFGNNDISNLTVTLNTSKTATLDPRYNPNDFLDQYINGATYPLDDLNAGETKNLEKTYFMFGAYKYVEPFTLTAILKFNDTAIDQATIFIPITTDE
jgi:hypothetical protein